MGHSVKYFIMYFDLLITLGLPWWLKHKESVCSSGDLGFDPWFGKIPWRREWQPTPVFLPGEFHRQSSQGLQGVRHDWATNTNTSVLKRKKLTSDRFTDWICPIHNQPLIRISFQSHISFEHPNSYCIPPLDGTVWGLVITRGTKSSGPSRSRKPG